MPDQILVRQLTALPLEERIELAQSLWESIHPSDGADPEGEVRDAIEAAKRRDGELAHGEVSGRTHQEVMESARRAVRCE